MLNDYHPIEPITDHIINYVNELFANAINNSISDIHIEPFEHHCRIRFRRDGLLHEAASLPPHLSTQIIARLKIMAELNIAEKRLPQDGRIKTFHHNKIDIRINTCPTLFGEKIVLRLPSCNQASLNIQTLGTTEQQTAQLLHSLSKPQGLILVTGPTGSGKTMTLYSALQHLNTIEKNISTIEDPVEIQLDNINQINIRPHIGLNFATALRTLLRQDPDIIMLGEIRDHETAIIAVQAAETGHLVLSTLHTNSAIESLSRLHSLGVSPYHLIHSTSLIIAQRLVRKLCVHCKQSYLANIHTLTAYTHPVGCEFCHQGYHGRTGIFELLTISDELAELAQNGLNFKAIQDSLHQQQDYLSLWDAGLRKVQSGITSLAELTRVVNA